jgi:pimeloyl-ACP methyl ester carboxylesterase
MQMKHLADLTDTKVAALYADVLPADTERFQAFCNDCPYRQLTYAGVDWPYLINARSGETLLLLSGALSIPDISWLTIAHFAKTYRVIAPAYPAVKTMGALVDGIAVILQHEGIKQAHVLGGSYGGFIAQVFVRRYPDLTRSLVLSHTFPPDRGNLKTIQKMARWMRLLPEGMLRWLMRRRLGTLMPAKSPETSIFHALFEELLYFRLKKVDLVSTVDRTVDYCSLGYTPEDLVGWPGRVLLVMSDDDPGTPESVRDAMRALYPTARLQLFHGTGHSTSVLKEQEYQEAIERFLEEVIEDRHTGI